MFPFPFPLFRPLGWALFFLCFVFLRLNGQTPASAADYAAQMNRFLADDSAQTAAELYRLYLNYSLDERFDPQNFTAEDSLQQKITAQDWEAAAQWKDSLLARNPLSPRGNFWIAQFYQKQNDPANAARFQKRCQTVVNAVFASANGAARETAILITHPREIPFLLAQLGYETKQSNILTVGETYFDMTLAKSLKDGATRLFYFDLSPMLNLIKRYQTDKKKAAPKKL